MMKLDRLVANSLKVLERPHVRLAVVALVVLYVANVLPRYSVVVNSLCAHPVVRVLALLAIMAVACKDVPLALLLAVAYVVSVQGKCMEHMEDMMEHIVGASEEEDEPMGEIQINRGESAPVNTENFAVGDDGAGPAGANQTFNCATTCPGSQDGDLSHPCVGVAAMSPEANAQGLGTGCPVGTNMRPIVGAEL